MINIYFLSISVIFVCFLPFFLTQIASVCTMIFTLRRQIFRQKKSRIPSYSAAGTGGLKPEIRKNKESMPQSGAAASKFSPACFPQDCGPGSRHIRAPRSRRGCSCRNFQEKSATLPGLREKHRPGRGEGGVNPGEQSECPAAASAAGTADSAAAAAAPVSRANIFHPCAKMLHKQPGPCPGRSLSLIPAALRPQPQEALQLQPQEVLRLQAPDPGIAAVPRTCCCSAAWPHRSLPGPRCRH